MPVTAIVLIYAACALCAVCSFKGHYRDRHAPIGHECEHFYYIPLETVKSKVIKKLIERNLSISKYPEESSSRKAYYLHREYQCMKVLLALIVPCAALDIVLAALGAERIGMGAVLCIFAYIVTYVIFAYVLMCADSERLNSYKYQIRIGEPLFIKSRTASPDKSKLNTLLDVFFSRHIAYLV